MNDDSTFIALIVVIVLAAMAFFGLSHAFNPKTNYINQCIRHNGIPDTHTNNWVCTNVKNEPNNK